MNRRYRVLAVASHPVQYMSPVLRRLAQAPEVELKVAYCSLRGAEAMHDPEFNVTVKWDVPLLDGYDWAEVENRGSGKESFFGLCNPGLWKEIRAGKYDAVLCYVGYVRASFWISYAACKLSKTAFLFGTDASSLVSRAASRWKYYVKKAVWPFLFSLADQVFMPSAAGVELMRSLGIPEERITLTPFVVDNDWWKARAAEVDRAAIRRSWGVSPNQRVVLFCAKLQPWKRPLDLLQAFSSAAVPESILVFAGEGPLRGELSAKAEEFAISSRVRFLGFTNQSQLPSVYSAADLFVLCSDYDPCPVVVCEAMISGLPVVLSDEIRGRFDLVKPGLTGEIYPCGDVRALSSVLERLLSNPSALDELSKNARMRMESWSFRESIAGIVGAIQRAVGRPGGS